MFVECFYLDEFPGCFVVFNSLIKSWQEERFSTMGSLLSYFQSVVCTRETFFVCSFKTSWTYFMPLVVCSYRTACPSAKPPSTFLLHLGWNSLLILAKPFLLASQASSTSPHLGSLLCLRLTEHTAFSSSWQHSSSNLSASVSGFWFISAPKLIIFSSLHSPPYLIRTVPCPPHPLRFVCPILRAPLFELQLWHFFCLLNFPAQVALNLNTLLSSFYLYFYFCKYCDVLFFIFIQF